MAKGTILRKIKINKYKFDLEIYPNLDSHEDITWEIFPKSQAASLYAFSNNCLLYTSPSPRDLSTSRMPSSA